MAHPKKKSGITVHCACCQHNKGLHHCCPGHSPHPETSGASRSRFGQKSFDEWSEERRIIGDLQAQERFVTRLVEKIKLMKLYNEETDARLKDGLKIEEMRMQRLAEFQKDFRIFQEKLFHIQVGHIMLLSLSKDVFEAHPGLEDLEKAAKDAIRLCLVINRKKRRFQRKLMKQCGVQRKSNSELAKDLRNTRHMQDEAERQVDDIIQNIKSCKDQVTQLVGFEEFIEAYKTFEFGSKLSEILTACH